MFGYREPISGEFDTSFGKARFTLFGEHVAISPATEFVSRGVPINCNLHYQYNDRGDWTEPKLWESHISRTDSYTKEVSIASKKNIVSTVLLTWLTFIHDKPELLKEAKLIDANNELTSLEAKVKEKEKELEVLRQEIRSKSEAMARLRT